MLQNVGTEFTDELAVLIINLYLVRGTAFRDDDVARGFHDGHAIGVEELTVSFATLSELELEMTFFIENLNSVVVRVGDYDVILRVHGHSGRFGELALHDPKLAEFAVIDHLLTFQLGFQRVGRSLDKLRSQVDRVVADRVRGRQSAHHRV